MIKYYTFYKNDTIETEENGGVYFPRASRVVTYESILKNISRHTKDKDLFILDVGGGITLSKCRSIPDNWTIKSTTLRQKEIDWGTQNNFDCVKGNILDLPFDDNTYDVTIAVLTLQYVTNQVWGISELLRVTKIGGLIIIGYDHEDGATSSQYLNIMNSHGLKNMCIKMGSTPLQEGTINEEDIVQSVYFIKKNKNNDWRGY